MSKTLSFLILFLLCFCQLVNADPSNEINSTENFIPGEEESLATVNNCVNVVTGSFFQVNHDLVVDGPEPLRFTRCYDSSHLLNSIYGFGFGSQYPLKIGRFWKGKKRKGESGHHYHAAIETQEGSYFEFKGEHSKGKKEVRVSLDPKIFKLGLSNYSDHEISAHTNMDNVRAKFTYSDKDKEVGKWDVNYPDGSCREYVSTKTLVLEKSALLYRIQHPTGNRTHFNYSRFLLEAFSISRDLSSSFYYIYNVNAAGEELNRIDHNNILFGDCSFSGYQMVGSNDQCVNYKVANETHTLRTKYGKESENFLVLKEVSAPHLPTTTYAIDESGKKGGFFKIAHVKRPEERVLKITYNSKGKVKELKAPIGKTSEPIASYTFDYGSKGDDKLTTVINALGTKTLYRINKHKRIKSVESFMENRTYCSKDFFWNEENGWLRGKAYRVSDRFVNKAIKYRYDRRGNIIKETFFGNLTGKGNSRFSFDGAKISGNPESCSTYSTYSNDGFNLKINESDDFGLKTLYGYRSSTNLLTKKFVLHHDTIRERTFHAYDANATLIKTIEDNGSSKDVNDFTGVTERLITTIIPVSDHLPSLGKPAEIKESCYDPETKQECLLRCTKCAYSPHGFLTRKDVFDANMTFAYSEIIEYDERDLVVKTVDALGQETRHDYDANHNKIYEEDIGSGKSTHYTYDFMNRPIQVKEQHVDGRIFITENQYDRVGNRVGTIDSYGNKTTYVYDTLNRLIETRYPPMKNAAGEIFEPRQKKQYDRNHRVICSTDERGFSTKTTYNSYDQPTKITHPDGSTETFVYFLNGRLKSKWDQEGARTEYAYDPQGRVLREAFYDKEGNFIEQTTKTYRGKRLIEESDFSGNITEYRYDAAGRKTADIQHSPEGERKTAYSYDTLGRLNKTTHGLKDGMQRIESKEYDFLDRVVEERVEDHTRTLFRKTAYAYDRNGNPTVTETFLSDEKTTTEHTEYDSHGKPVLKIDQLGHQTTMVYDYTHKNSLGQNVLKVTTTDPMGGLQVEIFDAFDRLVSLQNQTSDREILSHYEIYYDAAGNKREQIEHVYENNFPTRDYLIGWTYDSTGNISTLVEQDEERKMTAYTYDNAGRKRTIGKPDGVVLAHTYHPTGLLKTIASSEKSIAYTYRYDTNHNPVEMIDDLTGMTTSKRYNVFNELIEERQANGLSIAYQYDPLGRVTKVVLSDGSAIDYVYDAANLVEIHYKDTYRETYQAFDYRGLPWERYLNGDQKTSIRMEWDELGRKVKTDSTFWYEHLDIFDAKGNLRQLHDEDSQGPVTKTYRYDFLDQLIEEEGASNHTYHYDSIYNRLNKDGQEYIVNDLNQYESDEKAHYKYDPNGNLIEKDDGQTQQRFTYDAFNRLTSVTIPEGMIKYQYDADGRRLIKETIRGGQTTTTAFLYQFNTEIGAINENNDCFQLRILRNGEGTGSTVAVELYQELYATISDHRGSIRCLVDVEKKCVGQTYRYSAFGEQQFIGENFLENPWGFANKRRDEDTGHIHFLKRDYLPDLGRWLTTDPLDFSDGPNLYAYVRNNPLIYVDFYGLWGGRFVSDTWNNPRFQGSLQAVGGLAEAGSGSWMTLASGGVAAPLGWPVMAHGLDHFFTGMDAVFTGRPRNTVTSQLLQKTGMSPETADLIDGSFSTAGTMGGATAIRTSGLAAGRVAKLGSENKAMNRFVETIQKFSPFTKSGGKSALLMQKMRIPKGGLNSFSHAGDSGIKSYYQLRKLIKGTDLQAHHLIEKRFNFLFDMNPSQMKAIALTKSEHQAFTNVWRKRIPYGKKGTGIATRSQVMNETRKIYKNYPEILNTLGL